MSKNLILGGILALLVGFVWWKWSHHTLDTYSQNVHTQFAVENPENISRIFIADRADNQALLEKKSNIWYYTNKITQKTYLANPDAIKVLLETVSKIRTRAAVAQNAIPEVIKSMATLGKKVEIYDASNQKIRTYYVGTPADRSEASYMMMDGTEKPYVVYYPNWVGELGTRYICEEKLWRDKAIFRLDPNHMESVEVVYSDPKQAPYSFRIQRQGATFQVDAIDLNTVKKGELNLKNVAAYLSEYTELFSEIILYDDKLRDSIIRQTPFARIKFKNTDYPNPIEMRLYPIDNPTADRGDGVAGLRQRVQRYFLDIDEDEFFLVQHLLARKLLWGYNLFFQTDAVKFTEDETLFLPAGGDKPK